SKGVEGDDGTLNGESDLGAKVIFHQSENTIIRYESNASHLGKDYFNYIVRNSNDSSLQDSVTVEVLVIAPHRKHVRATDDLAATDSHHSVLIDVTDNDVTYRNTRVELPESKSKFGASIIVNSDDEILYTPIYGREGKDSFDYEIYEERKVGEDTYIERSRATVEVIVFCCNTVEFEVICEGNKGLFDVLIAQQKKDFGKLVLLNNNGEQVSEISNDNGTIKVVSDGDFPVDSGDNKPGSWLEYTPELYFRGIEKFTYEITDGQGFVKRVRLNVLVQACSETKLIKTLVDTPCDFPVDGKEVASVDFYTDRKDPKGDSDTPNGSASIAVEDGRFIIRYTPDNNFNGLDSLDYGVTYTTGEVKYNVLDILVDGYEDVRVETIFADTNEVYEVLTSKDFDDGYSLALVEGPMNFKPSVTTNEDGLASIRGTSIEYKPASGRTGDDSFRYVVLKDGKLVRYGTFHIIIDDHRKIIVEQTRRDTPLDLFLTKPGKVAHRITIQSGPVVSGATVIGQTHTEEGEYLIYKPAPGYTGTDSFTYLLEKEDLKTYGTVYIIVDSDEKIDIYTVTQDTEETINLFGTESNVSGFEIITNSVNGTARWDADKEVLIYKPNTGYTGQDKLTYKTTLNEKVVYGTVFLIIVCSCESFSVSGMVTDEAGNKLPNVDVAVVDGDMTTKTGPEGLYNINTSGDQSLIFSVNTHDSKTVEIRNRSTVDVILNRKQIKVNGSVSDQGGNMIGDALVSSDFESVRSNSSGYYETNVYAGTIITYSMDGHATETLMAGFEDHNMDVQLEKMKANINVMVRDAESGKILNGVEIVESGTDYSVLTDSNTSMEVPHHATLIFIAPGYEPFTENLAEINLAAYRYQLNIGLDAAMISTKVAVKDHKGIAVSNGVLKTGDNKTYQLDAKGELQNQMFLRNSFTVSAPGYK
ncbi:MAG: carboxypeptidase-like regulatory domain-containing protein, partial [Cyclobacteriaceae bacterium]